MVPTRPRTVALAMVALLAACQPASPRASSPTAGSPSVEPSSAPSASPSASKPDGVAGPLLEVVNFLSLETTNVLFTDWDGMKAAYGASSLTSAAPHEERLAFLAATVPGSATDAPYACFACRSSRADGLKTHWGFDNFDLAWEAEIQQLRSVVHVLRFMDGVDLAPLLARFDERGFSTEVRDGVTIRLHAQEQAEWWIQTDPSILNAAFLPDGRTLLLGRSEEALASALSQDAPLPAMRSAPAFRETIAALEKPTSAFLALDLNKLCNPFLHVRSDELQATVETLLEQAGPLHPYTLMAVGNRGSLTPTGRIVFGYVDSADAQADLAGRRLLAEEGVGTLFSIGHRLSEAYFTVVDARVSGGTLILQVGPPVPTVPLPSGVTSLGTALFLLHLFTPDAMFAACDISL
jgi:hypothetical protein